MVPINMQLASWPSTQECWHWVLGTLLLLSQGRLWAGPSGQVSGNPATSMCTCRSRYVSIVITALGDGNGHYSSFSCHGSLYQANWQPYPGGLLICTLDCINLNTNYSTIFETTVIQCCWLQTVLSLYPLDRKRDYCLVWLYASPLSSRVQINPNGVAKYCRSFARPATVSVQIWFDYLKLLRV